MQCATKTKYPYGRLINLFFNAMRVSSSSRKFYYLCL